MPCSCLITGSPQVATIRILLLILITSARFFQGLLLLIGCHRAAFILFIRNSEILHPPIPRWKRDLMLVSCTTFSACEGEISVFIVIIHFAGARRSVLHISLFMFYCSLTFSHSEWSQVAEIRLSSRRIWGSCCKLQYPIWLGISSSNKNLDFHEIEINFPFIAVFALRCSLSFSTKLVS